MPAPSTKKLLSPDSLPQIKDLKKRSEELITSPVIDVTQRNKDEDYCRYLSVINDP
jgi:hypothetical protein